MIDLSAVGEVQFTASHANSGGARLQKWYKRLANHKAIDLKHPSGQPVQAGDLVAGEVYLVALDGTVIPSKATTL